MAYGIYWRIAAFTAAVIVVLWAGLALHLNQDKSRTLANADTNSENLARTFAEHIRSTLSLLDQTLVGLVEDYKSGDSPSEIVASYAKQMAIRDMVFLIGIIGPDGYLRASNIDVPAAARNIGKQEHFLAHVERDTGQMFISKPVFGSTSERWSIRLSRRLNNPDGSFAGAVVLSLDPQYFSNFYKTIDFGPNGAISLVGRDGIIRARATGKGVTTIGQDVHNSRLYTELAKAPMGHYTQDTSLVDGVGRLSTYLALTEYPLIIYIGLATAEVMAGYIERRNLLLAAALAISLLIGVSAVVMARQLRRQQIELAAARQAADAANQAKSAFIANMSHELRTPLNAVIGFAQLIGSQAFGPTASARYASYGNNILQAGNHLLELINSVLDLSKIEAGKYKLHEAPVDIAGVIEISVGLVRNQALLRNVSLKDACQKNLPPILADEMAMRQILINLLANAIKFTPAGGRVSLSAATEPQGGMMIAVSDTGAGMTKDEIERAVKPFVQIDNPMVKQHEGTGLGLPIARRLTEMHGGAFEIDSEKSVGTTVRIRIPASRL